MLRTSMLRVLALMLLPLLVLLVACATPREPLPPVVVAPPEIPPLPQAARQPPTLDLCSPTCSEAWRKLVQRSQQRLTDAASPERPAPAPTTH